MTSNRRTFLKSAAATVAATWIGTRSYGEQPPADKLHAIRLGGPLFHAPADPEGLALAHRHAGYRAAYCPQVDLADKERIRDISKAFAKHDVMLAEVGRWCNLMEADAVKRAANLKTVTDGLALADEIGALNCVDIAGSFNPTIWYGPHPENLSKRFFDAAVANARKIIDAVKPRRAKFTYEVMGWAIPDGADSYLKLIKAIDRPAFGVHLDPCNAVNSPARFYDNTGLLNELFDKLGPWIVSCHAKDLRWEVEMNVHFREVPLGAGSLDYATYLKRLATLPRDVPLMMEHLSTAAEYEQSQKYVREVARKNGVGVL